MDHANFIDGMLPLQDRDLLHRLTDYFDTVDRRVRYGEGWLIYNASGSRSARITSYLLARAREMRPTYSYVYVPWRDFALSAYLVGVELKQMRREQETLSKEARENLELASQISTKTLAQTVTSDLLILSDLRPEHEHEVDQLIETLDRRFKIGSPTIILTPDLPHQLSEDIASASPGQASLWSIVESRLYEKNLVAM